MYLSYLIEFSIVFRTQICNFYIHVIHHPEVHIGKNCTQGLEYGHLLKTEGTFFPSTDRPRPVNNVVFFPTRNKAQILQQIEPGFAGSKGEKFGPLPEPIRKYDLQEFTLSHT